MNLNIELKELEQEKRCFFLLTLKNIEKGKRKLVKASVIIKRIKRRYNVNYIILTLQHHDFFGHYYQIVVSGALRDKELNVIEESIRLLFKEFKEEEIRLDVRLDKVAPLLYSAMENAEGFIEDGIDLSIEIENLLKGFLKRSDSFSKLKLKMYWGDVLRDSEFKELLKYDYTKLKYIYYFVKRLTDGNDE